MATAYKSVEALLESRQPQLPVYCIYPHVYHETARHFVHGFPGRVLYAVKANDNPVVIQALHSAGINHFDCASLPEIELVRKLCPHATCYLMNPVRLDGHAQLAQSSHAVRHFMIDHLSGLGPLLHEIDIGQSVIFARMAVSHESAVGDLSTKFGAPTQDIPDLLTAINDAGAEAALAFNVGTGVMRPEAYSYALGQAREVLNEIPFRIRLLDVGGGFPRSYPGFPAPPLDEYFAAIFGMRHELPLKDGGELLAEPGRALSAPGMSTITRVLLRKDERLYLNDGMYGAFWELRFRGQQKYPARCYRGHSALDGERQAFRLFGPSCDSSDELPSTVELPAQIDVGDYIEFGTMGAYSLSGITRFNGFYSDDVVSIEAEDSLPPNGAVNVFKNASS
ncbi:MAG: type III PLP-dependent enzyme [Gammaproteobacteria bacterium]|nr:type III PLP-dependent enzyme [Gammaproteobacteria bacterium]NNL49775.1 type III PLP-dependent enzyme [Woeseiaceae bacterium]